MSLQRFRAEPWDARKPTSDVCGCTSSSISFLRWSHAVGVTQKTMTVTTTTVLPLFSTLDELIQIIAFVLAGRMAEKTQG